MSKDYFTELVSNKKIDSAIKENFADAFGFCVSHRFISPKLKNDKKNSAINRDFYVLQTQTFDRVSVKKWTLGRGRKFKIKRVYNKLFQTKLLGKV